MICNLLLYVTTRHAFGMQFPSCPPRWWAWVNLSFKIVKPQSNYRLEGLWELVKRTDIRDGRSLFARVKSLPVETSSLSLERVSNCGKPSNTGTGNSQLCGTSRIAEFMLGISKSSYSSYLCHWFSSHKSSSRCSDRLAHSTPLEQQTLGYFCCCSSIGENAVYAKFT